MTSNEHSGLMPLILAANEAENLQWDQPATLGPNARSMPYRTRGSVLIWVLVFCFVLTGYGIFRFIPLLVRLPVSASDAILGGSRGIRVGVRQPIHATQTAVTINNLPVIPKFLSSPESKGFIFDKPKEVQGISIHSAKV